MATLDLRTDLLTRRLYANDASMYEELPQAVAFPRSAAEIQALVRWAIEQKLPITARAAGTSLAGQTTGAGLILDVSRFMTTIEPLEEGRDEIWVEPGVIRDTLNDYLAPHRLLYGPDTSTTNRCMIGGMIGNNSAGNFSIKYGSNRDHVLALDTVLSDGSRVRFGPLSLLELEAKKQLPTLEGHIYREICGLIDEHRDTILKHAPHPEIRRRNTGYALDQLCIMQPYVQDGPPFNLAKLLCGSEGTLALTTKALLHLEPLPSHNLLVISQFHDLFEALETTAVCVTYKPAAVELIDDLVLNATKGNIEQTRNRFFLEGEPRCILITQLDGDDPDELRSQGSALVAHLQQTGKGYHHQVMTDADHKKRVWDLRKAGLGLLMGLHTEHRSPEFVEDTAVRVVDLPAYISDFMEIIRKYDTHSAYYAHASVGELHLRPSIDVKSREGLDKMIAITKEVADLVRKYRGSFSGEHGDGRIRAPFLERVLGPEMVRLFEQVKLIWDPEYRLNPHKIVHPKPMDADLRFGASYKVPPIDTVFQWRNEVSFDLALEACNGAGVCRKKVGSGGTMCPSYRATFEERDVTRGRANLFRQLFVKMGNEAYASEDLKEALSLCLSCKACKSECPASVDMARMKAEFLNGYYKKKGKPLSTYFFGYPSRFYPLAQLAPGITNAISRSSLGKTLLKQVLGIHPHRTLPAFSSSGFKAKRYPQYLNGQTNYDKTVVLLVDLFSQAHDPEIPEAICRILTQLGYHIIVDKQRVFGRTQLSKGLVTEAKTIAQHTIDHLFTFASKGIPLIGIEPSELLTLRDEYLDLCDAEQLEKAQKVASMSFLFEEFLTREEVVSQLSKQYDAKGTQVYVHGHCHAKALVGMQPFIGCLTSVGFQTVDMGTGCCGMAGSFGYEKDTYDISMKVGEEKLLPTVRALSPSSLVCAHGFSCRHQIADGTGKKAQHPAVLIDSVLVSPRKQYK